MSSDAVPDSSVQQSKAVVTDQPPNLCKQLRAFRMNKLEVLRL